MRLICCTVYGINLYFNIWITNKCFFQTKVYLPIWNKILLETLCIRYEIRKLAFIITVHTLCCTLCLFECTTRANEQGKTYFSYQWFHSIKQHLLCVKITTNVKTIWTGNHTYKWGWLQKGGRDTFLHIWREKAQIIATGENTISVFCIHSWFLNRAIKFKIEQSWDVSMFYFW